MRKWLDIIERYKFCEIREIDFHAHCPAEKGELFHIMNDHGTEFEVMNFLHALVMLFKPSNILETGTQTGYSTIALAAACEFNGLGHVTTIERDPNAINRAMPKVEECGLSNYVTFENSDSVLWCKKYEGNPFDFAFFDSDLQVRHQEFDALHKAGKLNGLWSVHDTSRLRGETMGDYNQDLIDQLDTDGQVLCTPGLENHLSRGFRVFQLKR